MNCLRITPDKQFLAAAGNPHVRLFEIKSQNPSALVSYDGHTTNVTDVGERASHLSAAYVGCLLPFALSVSRALHSVVHVMPCMYNIYQCFHPQLIGSLNDFMLDPNQRMNGP